MATHKEQIWLTEYFKHWNATEAARRAGYKWPDKQGQEKKVKFANEIENALKHHSILDLPVFHKKSNKVYFIQAENGLIKIGIAADVYKRLATLDTASPLYLKLLFFIKDENARKLENAFHKLFSKKNIKGEWFKLDDGDIAWIENNYEVIE